MSKPTRIYIEIGCNLTIKSGSRKRKYRVAAIAPIKEANRDEKEITFSAIHLIPHNAANNALTIYRSDLKKIG